MALSIAPIRKDDMYGGFRVKLSAICETIVTPLSVNISIGNVVVAPLAVQYEFSGIFENKIHIRLWGYNVETVVAEKAKTISTRSVFNIRARDYYDIFIFATTKSMIKAY